MVDKMLTSFPLQGHSQVRSSKTRKTGVCTRVVKRIFVGIVKTFDQMKKCVFILICTALVNFSCSDFKKVGPIITSEIPGDFIGYATDISQDGSIIAMGAPFNDTAALGGGEVKILKNENDKWQPLGKPLHGKKIGGHFGYEVKLNATGKIVAISAPNSNSNGERAGLVQVFEFTKNGWEQLGQDLTGENPYDNFGKSVSLSDDGKTLAVGSPKNQKSDKDTGHIQVYNLNNGQWKPLGNAIKDKIFLSDKESIYDVRIDMEIVEVPYFGNSISLSGDGSTIAVGSETGFSERFYSDADYTTTGSGTESVLVFKWDGSFWLCVGNPLLSNEDYAPGFGESVSLNYDGSVLAIGCNGYQTYKTTEDGEDLLTGFVDTYQLNSQGSYTLKGERIYGIDLGTFGMEVCLDNEGGTLLVSSYGRDDDSKALNMNFVSLFNFRDGQWQFQGEKIKRDQAYNGFETSISLSNDASTLIIGNCDMDDNNMSYGEVLVYKNKKK